MEHIQRIGISLEEDLLLRFNKLIARKGYSSRSEAIRDLIREKLSDEQLTDSKTEALAAVFVVYDHHQANLSQKLIELQHSQLLKTISSMHIHVDHHNCLEVIVLHGPVSEITQLADNIVSLKGVRLGRVNLISVNE